MIKGTYETSKIRREQERQIRLLRQVRLERHMILVRQVRQLRQYPCVSKKKTINICIIKRNFSKNDLIMKTEHDDNIYHV